MDGILLEMISLHVLYLISLVQYQVVNVLIIHFSVMEQLIV